LQVKCGGEEAHARITGRNAWGEKTCEGRLNRAGAYEGRTKRPIRDASGVGKKLMRESPVGDRGGKI